jgi:hypothetical protein
LHLCLNLHSVSGYCINRSDLERYNLWLDEFAQDIFVSSWEQFAERYKGISNDFSSNIRLYGQIPEALRPKHLHLRQRYGRLWDQFLREAQEAGEIRRDVKIVPLRMFILGALNWTMEWFDPHRYSVGDFARHVNAVVFDGIKVDGK